MLHEALEMVLHASVSAEYKRGPRVGEFFEASLHRGVGGRGRVCGFGRAALEGFTDASMHVLRHRFKEQGVADPWRRLSMAAAL